MQRKTLIHAECPIARSLERVGEWWSILIMRDALHGLRRFEEFSRSLDIAPNMLTRRLNSLVEAGLLERQPYISARCATSTCRRPRAKISAWCSWPSWPGAIAITRQKGKACRLSSGRRGGRCCR